MGETIIIELANRLRHTRNEYRVLKEMLHMFLKCEKGKKMNQTERDAIEYINRHASELHKLSIADIAAGANVSTSTVSRAIRKCGMQKHTKD